MSWGVHKLHHIPKNAFCLLKFRFYRVAGNYCKPWTVQNLGEAACGTIHMIGIPASHLLELLQQKIHSNQLPILASSSQAIYGLTGGGV